MTNLLVNKGTSVLTGKSCLWTMIGRDFLETKSLQLPLKTWKGSLSLKCGLSLDTLSQSRPAPVTKPMFFGMNRAWESNCERSLAPASAQQPPVTPPGHRAARGAPGPQWLGQNVAKVWRGEGLHQTRRRQIALGSGAAETSPRGSAWGSSFFQVCFAKTS